MQKEQRKINRLVYLAWIATIVISFAAFALTSRPAPAGTNEVLSGNHAALTGET